MKQRSLIKGTLAALASASFLVMAAPATTALAADAPVTEDTTQQVQQDVVIEYDGPNTPQDLIDTVKTMSQDSTVFLMFHHPGCPHCHKLTQFFNEADGKTALDYKVLRVSIVDYGATAGALGAASQGVPETYIFDKGENRGRFIGNVFPDTQAIIDFMDLVEQELNKAPTQQQSLKSGPAAFKPA